MTKQNPNGARMQWRTMDLHLHTPASSDYLEPGISYLDILRRAEARQLDIIAFADHNTVAGYRRMREEIDQLKLLASLKRILPDEEKRLMEYERLLAKILVLPGFEFTATFGFHVMGVFSPEKPLRELEHILLDLNVPADQLELGSVTVGASADVLAAYEAIREADGLVIAAHANSSSGVAMRGFNFGGQTKIAYTQDPQLHALEVTDLDKRGRFSTAAFFSGTKPEYPRRMHCIQGSDAHRLDDDPRRRNNLGVGGRVTEVLLPEVSFDALKDLFESNDFARTRPFQKGQRKAKEADFDFVRSAREQGSNIVQEFHETMKARGGVDPIIADICAFANTNGGTLFIGASADHRRPVVGVKNPAQAINLIRQEISNRISPVLRCTVDSQQSAGKNVIRVIVPKGPDLPYAIDENKIYIRVEAETVLAVRDEIVRLVAGTAQVVEPDAPAPKPGRDGKKAERRTKRVKVAPSAKVAKPEVPAKAVEAPHTGVEVVSVEQRDGMSYYTVRDLRNGMVVNNVTHKSARKLWHYAITAFADLPADLKGAKIDWRGDFGLLRQYTQHNQTRYDFVQRVNGSYRYYFGVTEDGIHGNWREFVASEEPAGTV
ncbi:MAG: RNA-binding domain-containing protein [Anaerolineales bacterium]